MHLEPILSDLTSEDRDALELLPRDEKMEQLALLKNLPTKELLVSMADV